MQMFGMMILPCVQVEAGAQVIITQLFYDVEKFIKFTKDCRALGIECPIIPGQITLTVSTLLAWI
jgi:5,10-methylenetetrahydrofolate reductase